MVGPEQPRTQDDFLSDPDHLEYEIHCVECKRPLWHTKILKRSGNQVISTQTLQMSPAVPKFDRRIEKCPLCNKRFYAYGRQGFQMYMIRDVRSGIRRLI